MSSRIDPDLSFIPDPDGSAEPLSDGTFYLIDISDPIREYMQVPEEVRMCGVSEGAPYNAVDMLDIELSSLVPCMEEKTKALKRIGDHAQELLEDGQEQLQFQLKQESIEVDARTIPNTHEQLEHAKTVDKLGSQLYDIFCEHQLYDENGVLRGEHCTVLSGGVLVLRAN